MGLLDNIDEPTMAMAMGLLGSGGYSRMPVSTGQGMAAGFGAFQEAKRAQQEMAMRQADAGMRRDMFDLNKQQHQMQLDQMQRAQADRDTAKANLQAYVSSMPDGPQKQQIIQAVQMGIPMTEVWKKLNPEAKLETVFTQDGREQKAWTAPGQDIVPVGGAKAMPLHFANTGNAIVGVNQITGQPVGQGLQMQVSPDARLSAGTAMRGQNMTDARARENLTQSSIWRNLHLQTLTSDIPAAAGRQAAVQGRILGGSSGRWTSNWSGNRNSAVGSAKRLCEG